MLRYFLFTILFWGMASGLFAAETFRIGVAPHTSARVIISMYQPLRHHLAQALGRPVEIVTAPNFTETARRALAQEYDLVIPTGHQARLLQTDAGYLPLLTYRADFHAVALVSRSGRIKSVADLHGRKALGLSETSLVTLWGLHWLKSHNFQEMNLQYVSASDSVARLLLTGESDIGFVSLANYQQLEPATQSQLTIFAQSKPLAGRVYLLNKRHKPLQKRVESALWSFASSKEGKNYFRTYQLGGYRTLRPGELAAMEPYAAEVRNELKTAQK